MTDVTMDIQAVGTGDAVDNEAIELHMFAMETNHGGDFIMVPGGIDPEELGKLIVSGLAYGMLAPEERKVIPATSATPAINTMDQQYAKIMTRLATLTTESAKQYAEATKTVMVQMYDRGWILFDKRSLANARKVLKKAGHKFNNDERNNRLICLFNFYFPKMLVMPDGTGAYNPFRGAFLSFAQFTTTWQEGEEFNI